MGRLAFAVGLIGPMLALLVGLVYLTVQIRERRETCTPDAENCRSLSRDLSRAADGLRQVSVAPASLECVGTRPQRRPKRAADSVLLAQSSFQGLVANTASSGHSARGCMLSVAITVSAMSSAYSLLGLLRPTLPPHVV